MTDQEPLLHLYCDLLPSLIFFKWFHHLKLTRLFNFLHSLFHKTVSYLTLEYSNLHRTSVKHLHCSLICHRTLFQEFRCSFVNHYCASVLDRNIINICESKTIANALRFKPCLSVTTMTRNSRKARRIMLLQC